jgi:hypothetical protein
MIFLRGLSASFVFLGLLTAGFPASAETVDGLVGAYKRAVVKLTVTGKDPKGQPRPPAAGSGFVIQSGARNSLILTAAHVIGSSDWRQILNPDWLIEPDGRTLSRQVKVEILDEQGSLANLGQDASVLWQDDQKDIALLLIDRTKLPVIPYVGKASEIEGDVQHVLVLGFRKNEQRLHWREGNGGFQSSPLHGLVFRLSERIPEGMSGGPVIDLRSGKVIAAVSENVGTDNDHHAVSLFPVIPAVNPYLQYADKLQSLTAVPAGAQPAAANGQTVTGDCNNAIKDVSGSTITISGDRTCK